MDPRRHYIALRVDAEHAAPTAGEAAVLQLRADVIADASAETKPSHRVLGPHARASLVDEALVSAASAELVSLASVELKSAAGAELAPPEACLLYTSPSPRD